MVAAGRRRFATLRRKLDFDRVFEQPHRSSDGHFTVLARAGSGGPARLGLVVSKRVDKRAVKRNRLKRIIRESFRLGPMQAVSLDLVVIAKAAAATAESAELRRSLERHWQVVGKSHRQAQVG